MNQQALLSAVTAFIIAAGGALGVVFVGGEPTKYQILAAIVLGAVVSAKDLRALYKLPPVSGESSEENKP